MKHQAEIVAILQEIIQQGLLHIRAVGGAGDARTCAAIADHLHNLPFLCRDFSADLLLYYWEVERVSFCKQVQVEDTRCYQYLWDRLEPHIEAARIDLSARRRPHDD